eukprot:Gb_21848 [translate_table: standard]
MDISISGTGQRIHCTGHIYVSRTLVQPAPMSSGDREKKSASQALVKKLQDERVLFNGQLHKARVKIGEVKSEMKNLLKVIPQWEDAKEISEGPISHILEVARRILADVDTRASESNRSNSSTGNTQMAQDYEPGQSLTGSEENIRPA